MNKIPSPVDFYQKNLKWFDPKMYNLDAYDPEHSQNKTIRFYGDRRAGTTYTLLLTVLHDLLTNNNKQIVFMRSFTMPVTDDLFRTLYEMYKELEETTPNFQMFNTIVAKTRYSITFRNGSYLKVLNKDLSMAMRGLHGYDFWFVGDETQLYKNEDFENIERAKYIVTNRYNLRELYGN